MRSGTKDLRNWKRGYFPANMQLHFVRHAENLEAMKACSRRWYENNKERFASSHKNNRERLNNYWRSYYAKNKEQIKQRLCEQRQRQIGQNITRFEVRDQGFEKLEMMLVPSAENLQSIAENLQSVAENLQVLQKICRVLQKICRVLQKICRYCRKSRKSAGIAENLQSVPNLCSPPPRFLGFKACMHARCIPPTF